MKAMRVVWYALVFLGVLCSCRKTGTQHQEMVAEFVGKQIVFPEGLAYQIQETPVKYDPEDADYKIITYLDSTGCTPCRMKLPLWEDVINEFKSLKDVEVSFAMIIGTAPSAEVIDILDKEEFSHPVCFDSSGEFFRKNPMPKEEKYNTFLLDESNRAIAIGNPATNPKIAAFYKELINRKGPLGLCPNPAKSMGRVIAGDTIRQRFMLRNRDERTLSIEAIIPSCHCIAGVASADSIPAGESITVELTYIADSIGGGFHQYVDLFFNEKEEPERLSLHGFVINKPIINQR